MFMIALDDFNSVIALQFHNLNSNTSKCYYIFNLLIYQSYSLFINRMPRASFILGTLGCSEQELQKEENGKGSRRKVGTCSAR
ncbi:hypothetical protein I79_023557 [Cricetulus griseus]|uniref:Uncharacterized protein n=1 Tax=Cricetulus griseus TaxID=10029 RepID=G3II89_CRIGR|nr:hypothetical protein I79_023557 [Cricetulus griseus]